MQKYSHLLLLILVVTIFSPSVFSQGNSVFADTISRSTAEARRNQPNAVNFDPVKLSTILSYCVSKGVPKVQFVFATIRSQDTARYISRNPSLTRDERRALVGKPTILLRVPRSAFDLASNENPHGNLKLRRFVGGGLELVESYGEGSSNDLYFDSGTVCPPPSSCDL